MGMLDQCWTHKPDDTGYRAMRVGGRSQMIHRAAYEAIVGPIPDGLTLDHLCRNPPCYNPRHLEPVTPAENNRRAVAHRKHRPPRTHRCPTCFRADGTHGASECVDAVWYPA